VPRSISMARPLGGDDVCRRRGNVHGLTRRRYVTLLLARGAVGFQLRQVVECLLPLGKLTA
jgi:hypothetical protein